MRTSNITLQPVEEITPQSSNHPQEDEYEALYAAWLAEKDYYYHANLSCDRYSD